MSNPESIPNPFEAVQSISTIENVEKMVERFAFISGYALGQSLVETAYAERKAVEYEYMARFDSLTGLFNRRGVEESANEQLRLNDNVGLIYIDLDGFKDVNDTHGHHVGDSLLRSAGRTMSESLRTNDIVGRAGGDEFLIMADTTPRYDSLKQRIMSPEERIQVIIDRVQQSFIPNALADGVPEGNYGMSIGYVLFDPAKHTGFDDLIREADALMYQQKQEKKSTLAETGNIIQ